MFGQRNALFVDRRVYDKKGYWKNPQEDITDVIFYFISTPKTITTDYKGGRQTIKETLQITVFGEKPFAIRDKIVLATGERYEIASIPAINYFEPNILIKDMCKQRIESQILELE